MDTGGIPIAEGAGFAAVMTGARLLYKDDDDLLKAMNPGSRQSLRRVFGPARVVRPLSAVLGGMREFYEKEADA